MINNETRRSATGSLGDIIFVGEAKMHGFTRPVFGAVLIPALVAVSVTSHRLEAAETSVTEGLKTVGMAVLPEFLDAATDSITLKFPNALGGGKLKFGGTIDADALAEKKFIFTTSDSGALVWKKAFGLPWIDLTGVGLSLTIAKGEFAISLDGTVGGVLAKGASSKDREFVIDLAIADKKLTDFTFSLPNTTLSLGIIPGLNTLPGVKTFKIKAPTISLDAIGGTLSFKGQDANVVAFYDGDKKSWNMAMRLEKALTLGALVGQKKGLLTKIGFPKSTVYVSTKGLESDVGDLPLALQQFLETAGFEDDAIELVEGVTFVATLNPSGLPNDLKKGLGFIGLNQKVTLTGEVGGVFGGSPSMQLSAPLNTSGESGFSFLKKAPDSTTDFFLRVTKGSTSLGITTTVDMSDKKKNPILFDVDFALLQTTAGFEIQVAGSMQGDWKNAAGIKGFTLANPAISVGINSTGAFDLLIDGTVVIGKTEARVVANTALQPGAGFLPQSLAFAGTLNKLPFSSMIAQGLKAAKLKIGGLNKLKAEFREIAFAFMTPGSKLPDDLKETFSIEGAGMALNASLWLKGKELGGVKGYASTDGIFFNGVLEPFKVGPIMLEDAELEIKVGPTELPRFALSGAMEMFKGFSQEYEIVLSADEFKLYSETSFGGAFDAAMTIESDGFKPGSDMEFKAVLDTKYAAAFKAMLKGALKGLEKSAEDIKKDQDKVDRQKKKARELSVKIAKEKAVAKRAYDKAQKTLRSAKSKVSSLGKSAHSAKHKLTDKKKDLKKAKKKVNVKKVAGLLKDIVKLEVVIKGLKAAEAVAKKALTVAVKIVKNTPAVTPKLVKLEAEQKSTLAALKVAEAALKAALATNKGVTAATKAMLKGATAFKIQSMGAEGSLLGITSGGSKGIAPVLLITAKLKGKQPKTYKVPVTPKVKFDKIAATIAKQIAKELVKIFEKG